MRFLGPFEKFLRNPEDSGSLGKVSSAAFLDAADERGAKAPRLDLARILMISGNKGKGFSSADNEGLLPGIGNQRRTPIVAYADGGTDVLVTLGNQTGDGTAGVCSITLVGHFVGMP